MHRIASLLVTALCLSACNGGAPPPQKADPKDLEKIAPQEGAKPVEKDSSDVPDPVATINGKAVTAADFRSIYDLKVKKYADRDREIPPSADRRYRKSITERLIYQEVLRQEAATRKVEHDAAELTSRGAADRRRTAGGWAGRRCLTVSCSRRTGSGPRSAGRRGRLQSRLARSRRTAASRARGAEAGGGAGRSWSRRGPAGREAGRPAGTRSPSRTSPKSRAAAPRRARVWARSRARRAATGAGAALGGA